MDDLSKLPKWAQTKIKILEGQIKNLDDQLRVVLCGDGPIRWEYVRRIYGLPADGGHILIQTNSGEVEVRLRDGVLHIQSVDGVLVVEPVVSNHITVKVRPM